MTTTDSERLMTIRELSAMLGVPIDTLYGWRHRGRWTSWLPHRSTRPLSPRHGRSLAGSAGRCPTRGQRVAMAYIERRVATRREASGRTRRVVRYRVRYRDPSGRQRGETHARAVDADRRKAEIELELGNSAWRDPRHGDIPLQAWAETWLPTRHDLRATTWARLEGVMRKQVLPHFGQVPLNKITNGNIRRWVTELLDSGLSPATVRKAVFALRQCLEAAVADDRLSYNPALQIPLPSERQKPARFLSRAEVERLVQATPAEVSGPGAGRRLRRPIEGER